MKWGVTRKFRLVSLDINSDGFTATRVPVSKFLHQGGSGTAAKGKDGDFTVTDCSGKTATRHQLNYTSHLLAAFEDKLHKQYTKSYEANRQTSEPWGQLAEYSRGATLSDSYTERSSSADPTDSNTIQSYSVTTVSNISADSGYHSIGENGNLAFSKGQMGDCWTLLHVRTCLFLPATMLRTDKRKIVSYCGNVEIVKLLVEHAADIEAFEVEQRLVLALSYYYNVENSLDQELGHSATQQKL